MALLGLFIAVPASQAKFVVNGFGKERPFGAAFEAGGWFVAPRGVAVNSSGVGAAANTSYVVDSEARVERFGPTGAFERLWGQDVIATIVNEQQLLEVRGGGTFTLTFKGDTTAPIQGFPGPYPGSGCVGASAAIDDALDALPSIGGDANISVSGFGCNSNGTHLFNIFFVGALAGADQPLITIDGSELTPSSSEETLARISPMTDGANETGGASTGFEICTVAGHCKAGSTSGTTGNGGQLKDPQGVAVNQVNGHVYVTESGNRRVSEFDADGNFVRTWGWDVITSGQPNDTGTGFEICEVAAECSQGASGANGGQFGTTIGYPVTDASNNVWVPDPANRRIQKFGPTGTFIAAYGHNVDALGGGGSLETCASTAAGACQAGTSGTGAAQFATNSPRELAFDSSGNVFAIDTGNKRVQKFDASFTTASDFGGSTFPTFTTQAPEHIVATQGGTRLAFAINRNVGGNERQILELDAGDASLKETSLAGLGISKLSGLASSTANGDIYATTGSFSNSPTEVLVLGASQLDPPSAEVDPVTVKGENTATLTATIDPLGGIGLTCKFEYSTDKSTWTNVPAPGCAALTPTGASQEVSQKVSGLVPNTKYFVRLTVARVLDPTSTVTTGMKSFSTDSVPPTTTFVGAIQIEDTSARLTGTIDPKHSDTAYVFQYGTTPALGTSTAPLAIGDGASPVTVSQVVTGLSPNTKYYLSLKATNAFGTTTSTQSTFTTRSEPAPPPANRAWEMVTPPDKNFNDPNNAILNRDNIGVSNDGNAVGVCSSSLFGDPPAQNFSFCAQYLSRRTPKGWNTTAPFPTGCKFDPGANSPEGDLYAQGYLGVYPSADYSRFVFRKSDFENCPIPPLDPDAPLVPGGVSYNLYRQDQAVDPFSYSLLNPRVGGDDEYAQFYLGGSDDFGHIVYGSWENQTDPPDSPSPGYFRKLYEWRDQGESSCADPDGCLTLLSRDTSNAPFTTPSGIPQGSWFKDDSWISSDGARIYFQNPVGAAAIGREPECFTPGCQLYMREGSAVTYDVSAPECSVPSDCGEPETKADAFITATDSGEVALFMSCAKLTDASSAQAACVDPKVDEGGTSGAKLYRWDLNGASGHKLIDLSADHEPADGLQPNFRGVMGTDESGGTVFFVASGQIVPGESTESGEKVYRWTWNNGSPSVEYLGPFQMVGARFSTNPEIDPHWMLQLRLVTPDGKNLLVYSGLRLDPISDHDADADAYRWNETEGWTCVSCQLPGVESAGDVSLDFAIFLHEEDIGFSAMIGSQPRFTMDDSGRVFFGTPDALVSEDVNGEAGCPMVSNVWYDIPACLDVYEWRDGKIRMLSTGTSDEPVRLITATRSGRDVFLLTVERMVGWDVDLNNDVYDLRIGGGFPEPPPQPPTCEGEACRGAGSTAADIPGAGTAVFEGAPNQKRSLTNRKRCRKGFVRRGKRCINRKRLNRKKTRSRKRARMRANNHRRAGK